MDYLLSKSPRDGVFNTNNMLGLAEGAVKIQLRRYVALRRLERKIASQCVNLSLSATYFLAIQISLLQSQTSAFRDFY